MDEQWGYVGAKSRQRWLFYAYDRLRKTVVAHVFGERTMATLGRLMSLLSPFDVVIWMTDGWPLYESRLKGKLHVISKRYTQRIERHNLNLRAPHGWDGSRCRSQNRWSCMTKSSGII
jgi:insertion element IS1 protein InsB